ncbi:protein of unknown function [Tranquillimonas rosea]|uniref:YjiS-like domain-containing protein n=1 Tax=Tranquillimonas rosea TaxID=641238 RepID=A0A1H9WWJ0_9RHOB|nr:DUF1127 domain-containing protein [Tranquillimonas rosea]SES38310.1 protein of unknown function [Tranquillimonas rosea]
MAFITATNDRGLRARFAETVATLRDQMRERARRNAVYRQVHNELSSCTDRDLADMGFHRSQIGDIAQQAADRA